MIRRIHDFSGYVNEQQQEAGYGEEAFFYAKDGDSHNYFFKIKTEKGNRCFIISVSKYSKYTQPAEAKNAYGVLNIIELQENELDQAVTDKGVFKSNTSLINVGPKVLTSIMAILVKIVEDYLQKDSKVVRFYDELQYTISSDVYDEKIKESVAGWSGNWNLQEVEQGKLNIISK